MSNNILRPLRLKRSSEAYVFPFNFYNKLPNNAPPHLVTSVKVYERSNTGTNGTETSSTMLDTPPETSIVNYIVNVRVKAGTTGKLYNVIVVIEDEEENIYQEDFVLQVDDLVEYDPES